ncbi:hypothetical protein HNI00_04085 [Thermoleptolyngbya oregonensis NK1-22]|uniref:Uncharacterized protein n=1 Tax=Thermoleptolyngbya oregonensis NK1-22 TaxID=2547457 RepID=A0AA96Y4E0_9CYAN|nr:hypothetical protein [Thermoleptolyngbya oregonensis]WOB42424.1 hypothetical protein HNI00_04085 [Thermoleptolyngbya oregonensis NK1-22]
MQRPKRYPGGDRRKVSVLPDEGDRRKVRVQGDEGRSLSANNPNAHRPPISYRLESEIVCGG